MPALSNQIKPSCSYNLFCANDPSLKLVCLFVHLFACFAVFVSFMWRSKYLHTTALVTAGQKWRVRYVCLTETTAAVLSHLLLLCTLITIFKVDYLRNSYWCQLIIHPKWKTVLLVVAVCQYASHITWRFLKGA